MPEESPVLQKPVWRVLQGIPAVIEGEMNLLAQDFALHLFIPGVVNGRVEVTVVMVNKAVLQPGRIAPPNWSG